MALLRLAPLFALFLSCLDVPAAGAQSSSYPPLADYMMAPEDEIALARSAAPEGISSRATIRVLGESGYETVVEGDNGFVCLVLRAPICFNPVASRTVLPYQELRAKLGMAGRTPDQIADAVQAAYVRGELPRMEAVGFGYMWSADQVLGPAGASHPHMMVYTPYYDNAMLGGNEPDGTLPFVGDDPGTPFAVAIIPLDDRLAIEAARGP